ncbi:MAG: iron chelate uptake ABC transporter family permease subunit [Desulfobacteraceae bacterium]|jgi:manganese/zinc/iron transport system permease protein
MKVNLTYRLRRALVISIPAFWCVVPQQAAAGGLTQPLVQWPSWQELLRVLTFQDYNTRVVIIGATLLGLAAGLVGTFLLLRKRALLSDTISHATLPGIAIAFIVMSLALGDGKNLLGLIAGAALFSVIGTAAVMVIQKYTRLKEDAALGIVLSVFFGLGIALMGMATRMSTGNAAGLSSFIYGKTASMLFFDAMLIALAALGAIVFCVLFFKEFSLICFDADYGATQGWPVHRLDFLMMTLVVVVTVIGLQAVGLILVVALLIIPSAAARFWTFSLRRMLLLSGLFGALSGMLGAGLSALMANLPAGAVIVLTASSIFLFSMIFGSARGILRLLTERIKLRRRIMKENLLRDIYEWFESARPKGEKEQPRPPGEDLAGPRPGQLLNRRAWSPRGLQRTIARLKASKDIVLDADDRIVFTDRGETAAGEVVRKHRLWEAYLISHADVATGMVDLSADRIEHILDEEIIGQLEKLFPGVKPKELPKSPHALPAARGAA